MTKQSISAADAKRKAQSQFAQSRRSDPTVPQSERRRKIPDAAATAEAKPAQAGASTAKLPSIKKLLRQRRLDREEAAKNLAERGEKPLEPTNDRGSASRSQGRSAELLDESQQLHAVYVPPPPPSTEEIDGYDPSSDDDSDDTTPCTPSSDCPESSQQNRVRITVAKLMEELRKEGHGGVWLPPLARRITDNGDQAICLSQVLYWFDKDKTGRRRARCFKNGRYWVYKTHAQLGKETGISPARVKVCLKALEDKGFIIRAYCLANGLRTTHISVEAEHVFQAMTKAYLERENAGQHDLDSRSVEIVPTGQPESCLPDSTNRADL